jgi:cytochrome c oxidase subunit 1
MNDESKIHLPAPSFWPITLAFGLALLAVGVVSNIIISIVGVIVLLVAIAGWTLENRSGSEKEEHHE